MKTLWARPSMGIVFLMAFLAVLIAVLCLPRGARTALAATQGQGSKFNLEGKITDLSPGKLTVSTEDNIIFHVTYDDRTVIRRKDATAGSSKDLASGEKIQVDGTLTPAGVIEADSISIE
jgi:methyl coenzyme M reductase subunit C